MVLAIDIGNTNIVLGCCRGEEVLFRERVSTVHTSTVLEYAAILRTAFEMNRIDPADIHGAIISSVVPPVTGTMKAAGQKYLHVAPLVVGPGIKTGLRIQIDNPAQLGSDLVVDREGNYRGGMILPGVVVSSDSLISRTAQLQKVAFEVPKNLIGRNTIDCMKSGILYGNAGALDGLIDRINAELGEPCTVIATGGLAGVITPLCRNKILLDDDLLLKGLLLLYNKNTPTD